MKAIFTTILLTLFVVTNAQQVDAGMLLSGSDLDYYKSAEMEIDTYLKNKCHQINAAKRAMILDYGLLKYTGNGKQNVTGLKRVQGWNAVLQIKYGCTEKDYYNFTQFFRIKTNN